MLLKLACYSPLCDWVGFDIDGRDTNAIASEFYES